MARGAGWGFKDVARLLRGRGFEVYAPTLTGLAERRHVKPEYVTLSSHIADIAGLMKYEELQDVLLVGHSYGGMVITGAADREIERIAGMIYLDAFLPVSGELLWDIVGEDMALERADAEAHDGGKSVLRLPGASRPGAAPPPFAWEFTPQPTGTLSEKFVSVRSEQSWPKRHYAICTEGGRNFQKHADRAAAQGGFSFSEFAAPHDVPRTQPQWVADRITQVAGEWGLEA